MDGRGLIKSFKEQYGKDAEILVRAPGRVNLIGEHTDYNDGFVFPADIDHEIWMAAGRRTDRNIRAFSVNFQQPSLFSLDELVRDPDASWSDYIRGVLLEYQKRGSQLDGMDLVVAGDVPVGAGLSSSAAMEVATAETARVLNDIAIGRVELALLSQAAERNFVGVQCGIMDQFVSVLGRAGTALLLDCRDLSFRNVPLSMSANIVICDTRKERALERSEYNRRREECEEAVEALSGALGRIKALRDVVPEQVEENKSLLTETQYKRARHVVTENARVLRGVDLLETGDIQGFGKLMYESHTSLRDDYEVSCPELDILVDLAGAHPGTIGARMTGAGFGGCTVNIVESDAVEHFRQAVGRAYQSRTGIEPLIYVCQPSDGVSFDWLD